MRHTVIQVIGAHLRSNAPTSWQGCDLDFSGAVFDGGDLHEAVFSDGKVDFSSARFSGGTVDLRAVTFAPECRAQSVHSLLEIPEDQPLPTGVLADTGPVPVQRG